MKIITVANSKQVKGGITSVVNSLLEGLSEQAPEIRAGRHASYIDSVPPPVRILYSLLALFRFLFVIPGYRAVHLHSAADGSFYRKSVYTLLCKLLGKKVVFHIHGSSFEAFHNSKPFHAKLIRWVLNRADTVIVLSEQMKGLVHSYCGNPRVHILPNPIRFPNPEELASLRRAKDKVELLFMGELGQRKGIYDLILAMSILPPSLRNRVVLHICGNKEIDKVTALVQEKGLQELCIVHGWTAGEKKKAFFANADVYILPSYHEGLPVSILEAMSYSLPIISTGVGGIPEIVIPEENGLLVTPGSIGELNKAICRLVDDEDLRKRMGQRSRELAGQHDLVKVVEELRQIYREVEAI